jgi:hypothetical protein
LQVHHAVEADIKTASMNDDAITKENDNCVFVGTRDRNEDNDVPDNNHPTQRNTNAYIQGLDFSFAGDTTNMRIPNADHIYSNQLMRLPGPPNYKVSLPALLPGTRCYCDASTSPDNHLQVSRFAGLGIFIVNTLPIFIKIKQKECSSVIMAEAAALAIGAHLLNALDVQQPFFLTDNQLLVNFFNGKDHADPPRWDIKPLT